MPAVPHPTRRTILYRLAAIAGAGAAQEAMTALGLLPVSAQAAALNLPPTFGAGKSVAVLGAGLSGLCAAYELDRAGYAVLVLEANTRAGGRSLTLRGGDVVRELGSPPQLCEFTDGLYLNAGPGRIAHHNVNLLAYCRQFGVTLEPYIFANRAAVLHATAAGQPSETVSVGDALYSLQGHVAELLDKCVQTSTLDQPLTGEDVRRLHDMLVRFGDLSRTTDQKGWIYRNASGRAGFAVFPGLADAPPRPLTPMALDDILRSDVWNSGILNDSAFEWQSSLLQPVGGMDMVWRAFLSQPLSGREGTLSSLVQYNAPVRAIETGSDKITIMVDQPGGPRRIDADYCISTIPMPIFAALQTNLDSTVMRAAANLKVANAGKVGWQAERFWETTNGIYGGISWVSGMTEQFWYPSDGFLSPNGVVTGAYMRGRNADAFNPNTVEERLRIARAAAEELHPGKSALLTRGIAIAWDRMEYARQGWTNLGAPDFEANARILAQPHGRLFFAGDQLTFLAGWQEGAIIAALDAVTKLAR